MARVVVARAAVLGARWQLWQLSQGEAKLLRSAEQSARPWQGARRAQGQVGVRVVGGVRASGVGGG